MAKFYWASSKGDKGIHWKAWDSLCLEKNERELDFKDLECMNLVLLVKQRWRLVSRQASLLYKVGGDIYGFGKGKRHSGFPLSRLRVQDNWVWHHTKCGSYTTSSGYKSAREMKKNDDFGGRTMGGSSGGARQDTCWKDLLSKKIYYMSWLLVLFLPDFGLCHHGVLIQLETHGSLWGNKGDKTSFPCWLAPFGSFGRLEIVPFLKEKKSEDDYIKVNVDAAYWKEINSGAIGVVGRQHNGVFMGAAFYRIPYFRTPLLAECLAIRAGIEMAWMTNWK
ncbi:hypothetical protein LIER_43145 [Lithospermum erythrorhizon]|uniref:RNase H type-1 domain-containing protein n=1 Tax=Lithospermum erythrorhizon TaxID=34254 RepID=A0AAV3PMD1_LITER